MIKLLSSQYIIIYRVFRYSSYLSKTTKTRNYESKSVMTWLYGWNAQLAITTRLNSPLHGDANSTGDGKKFSAPKLYKIGNFLVYF